MAYSYSVFGLSIVSDIPLPAKECPLTSHPHLSILIAKESYHAFNDYHDVVMINKRWHLGENKIIFHHEEGVIFRISSPWDTVEVIKLPDLSIELVQTYILTSVMGILLYKYNIIPLHASAVLINNAVHAFMGNSGMGKSTLAAALLDMGYDIIDDNITAISITPSNVLVSPGFRNIRLWSNSFNLLRHPHPTIQIAPEFKKYYYPQSGTTPFSKLTQPIPLNRIYWLKSAPNKPFQIHPLSPKKLLRKLEYNIFFPWLASTFKQQKKFMENKIALSTKVSAFAVKNHKAIPIPDLISEIECLLNI
jgi:hypothetical protein